MMHRVATGHGRDGGRDPAERDHRPQQRCRVRRL